MRLFNRPKKTQTLAEMEDYYAKRRNRPGMAWVMAFLSLLVTVLVLAGLFFGGRWAYRALTDNDNEQSTTSETDTDSTPTGAVDESGNVEGEDTDTAATEEFPNVVSDEAASTDEPSERDEVVDTGTDDEDLPNTGAGDILLILPMVAFLAGYLYNRQRQLSK